MRLTFMAVAKSPPRILSVIDSLGLPTYDETPRVVRVGQAVPRSVYWVALGLSGVLAGLTLILTNDAWTARAGAFSALFAALSAAGFVLHDQPRILRKSWSDLSWDPDLQDLVDEKLIDYESTASGVWLIRASEHHKGRVPVLRITERRSEADAWQEWVVDYQVSTRGDIAVLVDVARDQVDSGREVRAIVS